MRRRTRFARFCALVGFLGLSALPAASQTSPSTNAPASTAPTSPPPSKFRDFGEVTRGAERFDGLLTLYRNGETLYGEIKPNQLDQPFIAPMAIARGMAMAGVTLNHGDEWILVFHRTGDKLQVLRRNIHYRAPENTPLQKAVKQNYTDSVLLSLPIVTINPGGQGVLVDFGQIFLTDFAQLGFGSLDRNRSTWAKVKAFPNNVELQVEATFSGRSFYGMFFGGDDGVADPRGLSLVIHYSLAKLPDSGYKPRLADHRVGYFLNATKDFGSADPDTEFVRYVNRWRLEKADPKAKLSPPKKQLVWWVEDTVPQEFRPYVEEGILEWNKAFDKIGIRNALAVRWQNERDEFDPEDINYCTFRWITTSTPYAMSTLRSNPLTGEMIDGDVIFDASFIRYWKTEYAYLVGTPLANGATAVFEPASILGVGEILSPIMAAKYGYGLPFPLPGNRGTYAGEAKLEMGLNVEVMPSNWTPLQMELRRRLAVGQANTCQIAALKGYEYGLAAMALAQTASTNESGGKLPEEFLAQCIKEIVMHEVGHSLGLRHNFKGSTMLPYEQINDTTITHAKGMSGSVMDYHPVNIAPKGQKQGDYATTTIGPYDYWAIEYAYKPIDGDEPAELKKIASRSPQPDLVYATDENVSLDDDPLANRWDLGSDPMQFGKDRLALASELLKNLDERVVKDGESWARLRSAFSVLFAQYGNATFLAASYIGGQYVSRDFKGGDNSRDPIVPVPGDKQREALNFLTEGILSDRAFQFSPSLLRRLASEYWYHWGSSVSPAGAGVDYPIYSRVLAVQRLVLNQCFNGAILSRIQNQELQSDPKSKPLRMEEIFSTLTDGIWSELSSSATCYSTIRRNLQREHLRRLMVMVVGNRRSGLDDSYPYLLLLGSSAVPADAKSLARLHLEEIAGRIAKVLDGKSGLLDDTTRAHLVECRHRISKTLDSSYTANDL